MADRQAGQVLREASSQAGDSGDREKDRQPGKEAGMQRRVGKLDKATGI